MLQKIALAIQSEMGLGRLVTPLNAKFCVEQHNAIGGRLHCRQEVLESSVALLDGTVTRTHQIANAVRYFSPDAETRMDLRGVATAQPSQQSHTHRHVDNMPPVTRYQRADKND
jgi:hypothetical protein